MTPAEQPRLDRADVERVLAEHQPGGTYSSRGGWVDCTCDEHLPCLMDDSAMPDYDDEIRARSAHLADVLLPLLRPADERAARAEALREAADDPEVARVVAWRLRHYHPGSDSNGVPFSRFGSPAEAALSVLRDRADREGMNQCDNYLPPLTCLTAPSSESGRCNKCRTGSDQ